MKGKKDRNRFKKVLGLWYIEPIEKTLKKLGRPIYKYKVSPPGPKVEKIEGYKPIIEKT